MSPAQPRVAVVGAGVAGLACARALVARSNASVVCLSAGLSHSP
jgi:cation diffusion facilitator CzcD-associated flavoprotein CzcO